MRTGCRCRKTFDSITSTRLRSLSGRSCRNTDFQTCVSVSQFQNRTPIPSWGAIVFVSAMVSLQGPPTGGHYVRPSHLQERFRIDPLSELVLVMLALVHQDLAVVGQDDARAFERPRRRTFEVDAGQPETAAVAG